MTFITFAQNFEDVMLWRALKHVARGFYIDVGANHPADDSVTKAFYDRGWSGINIEPLTEHIAQLRAERPRDINLQIAAGASEGELEIFATPIRGLATASGEVAQMHHDSGLEISCTRVKQQRLTDVCEEYVRSDIHFLKIDVEGFEDNVLAGMDLSRFRPWIIVVEATIPNSQQVNIDWEHRLLDQGYLYTYFDGINRYYVAGEHAELQAAFQAPPNVFDQYITIDKLRLSQRLSLVENQAERAQQAINQQTALIEELSNKNAELQRQLEQTGHTADQLQHTLHQLYASGSWRLTKPVRFASALVRRVLIAPLRRCLGMPKRLIRALRHRDSRLYLGYPEYASVFVLIAKALGIKQQWHSLKSAPPLLPAGAAQGVRFDYRAFPQKLNLPETLTLPQTGPEQSTQWIRFTGHIEGHYSLAIVNRGLALALDEETSGKIRFVPCNHVPYENPRDIPAGELSRLQQIIDREIATSASESIISIVHHYPLIEDALPAKLRLAVFFWEESVVPSQTIERINDHYDAILVASLFVKNALINSGCRLPVAVIPMGVDQLIEDGTPPITDLRPKAGRYFRFLHVSSAFDRKGVDVLLQAYFDHFTGADPVELYIKTFPNPHNRIHEQHAALHSAHPNPPRVIIDENALERQGMRDLYEHAQALVLPTRGEGFNLPAAEAMALGLPVITTGYGAHTDFCTDRTAELIPYRFAKSGSHLQSTNSYWVEPDARALGLQMRQFFDQVISCDPLLEKRRQTGIAHIRAHYRWRQGAQALLRTTDWLENHPATPSPYRIALLSPWATRCGVAEYSHELMAGIQVASDFRLDIYCDDRTTASDSIRVHAASWQIGDSRSVEKLLQQIEQEKYDSLLVQHQPSLFRLDDAICKELARIRSTGCVTVLELHSTQQLMFEHRLSGRAISALRNLDRIIVHKLEDLNNLLSLGISENLLLLPLGTIQAMPVSQAAETRAEQQIGWHELVIASFGFLFPHKGIDAIIESIAPLQRATGRPVRFLSLNATPDALSEETLDQYKELARTLGVDNAITWKNQYLPISECQRLLDAADYIVYPYRDTRESASAAVTLGLASLKPVLVSPSHIFSDLRDVTVEMAGTSGQDIVDAILTLERQPETKQALLSRQKDWLNERNWSTIASRFESVVRGLVIDRELHHASNTLAHAAASDQDTNPKQLLVDVSELYFRDARTGIQRVVRSILGELIAAPPAGYMVCPVFATKGEKYRHTDRFNAPGHPGQEGEIVRPQAGDVFLGLDLSAHLFPEAERELNEYRAAGVRIHYVIYDLIPLFHAKFADAGLTYAFQHWIDSLSRVADGLHCISNAVAEEVRVWLYQNAKTLPLPEVAYFHLGADIDNSTPSKGLPDDAEKILAHLRAHPSFLAVGTIEPRKGHIQMLDAFETLWIAESPVILVIVGKEGWMMESFTRRLRNHPELGRRLFWLEGISDEYLEKLYATCRCLIAASEIEGFGLPLIESAQHKLPIIARDIPVFREVAGEHAYYYSGESPEALSRAISAWLDLDRAGKVPKSEDMPWLTWRQSARNLLCTIIEEQ